MTDTCYSWVYQDPFHSCFVASTTALSLGSNALLLYILYRTRIGPYAYLLAVFAVCDMLTSCAHAAFQPFVHMTYGGFYFFPRHGEMMIAGKSFDTIFALIFIATYYQTFLVLAYHFVYRYKVVSRGIVSSCTTHWRSKQWAILGILANVLYIATFVSISSQFTPSEETRAIVPKEIKEIYGIDLRDLNRGFTVLAVRRPDPVTGQIRLHISSVIGITMFIGLFSGTGSVILYCMWRTNRIMKSSFDHLAAKTRKIQMDLFKSLLIQTAIPVLFSYAPLASILLFPTMTGISLGAFGNVLYSITSIFPCIDAFFVLYFIRVLRIAVIRIFHLPIRIHNQSAATADLTTMEATSPTMYTRP